jgi:hypothetical protein
MITTASMVSRYGFCGSLLLEKSPASWLRCGIVCLQPSAYMSSPATKLQNNSTDVKPFSEMPGPKGLPLLGNVWAMPKYLKDGYCLINLEDKFAKYGPIFKENLLGAEIVHVCDVNGVERVHRLEGKYPRRVIPVPWKTWREEQGLAKGILIGQVYKLV